MERFFLPTPELKNDIKIDSGSKFALLGSCFSEEIGNKLIDSGFSTAVNPFGIIYNPWSIAHVIDLAMSRGNKGLNGNYLFSEGECFHWDFHSRMRSDSQKSLRSKILSQKEVLFNSLATGNVLIITLGTAVVYSLPNGKIVANCHKQANHIFTKSMMMPNEIEKVFTKVFSKVWKVNPDLKVIFTVSPVRHLREGLIQNNQSKASLILAIKSLCERFPIITYFPSFEMAIDCYRDSRFYKEDLIHPNGILTDLIWKEFVSAYFTEKAHSQSIEYQKLQKFINHKPLSFEKKSLTERNEKIKIWAKQLENTYKTL